MKLPRVRSRWLWLALAVVTVVASLGVLLGRGEQPVSGPSPTATPTVAAQQATLLIQARNDDDLAVGNVIAVTGGGAPPALVQIPSRLIVDPPGSGSQTLSRTARPLNRTLSQTVLGDQLALRIDGTLSLGRLALAGMVDFVGGIDLDVATPITTIDEQTGQSVMTVEAGQQHLTGTQAASYALTWLPGEPESTRLSRYNDVLIATVIALPTDQLRIEQMLTSLGGSARTTTTTSQVAAFLLSLRASLRAGDANVRLLPTQAVSGVGSTASPSGPDDTAALGQVRIDLPATQALLEQIAPSALRAADEARPRVLLQDGVGAVGTASAARMRVSRLGMVPIQGAPIDARETTLIEVASGEDAAERGRRVAEALDVPESAVHVVDKDLGGADVLVLLGADFEA